MAIENISANPPSIEHQLAAAMQHTGGAFTQLDILLNMSLALVLGMLLASVYRYTHKGLSYSQSFTLTIVFVTTIVAISLMAIESSLARAFALVGAMSIIRFRTVVKDTKDTAYVFAGLAIGMASGTGGHFLAVMGTVFISAMALVLYKTNFGATTKSEFMLRFTFEQSYDSKKYLDALNKYCKRSSLLHVEPSGNGQCVTTTIDVVLKGNQDTNKFVSEFTKIDGVSDVNLIASKSDVDY